MEPYLLGIDLGTSGTKTVLFDTNGQAVCEATQAYPLYQPRNGWAEQAPEDWYAAAVSTIRDVLRDSGVAPEEIIALGISGQMHGLVMLDERGDVLRRSIIWADQRTGAECEEITRIVGARRLIEITANPALTGFTASKIRWVQNNEPALYAKCRHILLPKDYLRYRLTGEFATEVSDASGMQLLDVPRRQWSQEMCDALGIDPALLARVYESPEVTGRLHAQAAKQTGLSESTLVVGGAGDNAAAAVGTGTVRAGRAFSTIGTSGVVYAHTDAPVIDPKGRVHTFCCAVPDAWHVMGVVQAAGLSLQWLRDTCCGAEKETAAALGVDVYDIMTREAARSPIGANRLVFLPYLMGERTPHLDPNCRGAFIGLSAMHRRSDLVRATMEGVTFAMNDSLSILREMKIEPSLMLAVGGGGKSAFWRQMLADVFACPIETPQNTQGAALGAAILAGVGAGVFASVPDACDAILKSASHCDPDAGRTAEYGRFYALYQRLYPALKASYDELHAL